MRAMYKPGPGWKHLAGPVYEHGNGARVHLLGTVRLPGGTFINHGARWHGHNMYQFIDINGGNRKRGLMAFAMFCCKDNGE